MHKCGKKKNIRKCTISKAVKLVVHCRFMILTNNNNNNNNLLQQKNTIHGKALKYDRYAGI